MQKTNTALYSAIAFLITAGAFIYTWKMIIPEYQQSNKQLAKVNKDIEYAKVKLDSLNSTKNNLSQLGDLVNQMLVSIPSDKDTPNLITELEVIALSYKIVLPSIQISDSGSSSASAASATANSQNVITVSFSADGSFEDLNNMILSLEKDIRFMNVKAVTLTKPSDKDAISMTIQLSAYKRTDTSLTSGMADAQTGLDSSVLNSNQ